jgi:transposase
MIRRFRRVRPSLAKVGVAAETLRRWVRQALIDQDVSPGVKTVERQRIKELERQVRVFKRQTRS